jgi:YgiT-type zinc finger domain-containing protein
MGSGVQAEESVMKCIICKTGGVEKAMVQAEIRLGCDRLLVPVEAEVCPECGESYYSAETLRHLERVRDDFARKVIAPASVGKVYQVS